MKFPQIHPRFGELAIGLTLGALGLAMVVASRGMGFGTLQRPGSGFMPGAVGLALLAIGVGLAAIALLKRSKDAVGVDLFGTKPLLCMTVLLGAAIAFTEIGFVPTSFLFLAILFASLGEMALPRAIAMAAVMTTVAWLLFVKLLAVQLPPARIPFLA